MRSKRNLLNASHQPACRQLTCARNGCLAGCFRGRWAHAEASDSARRHLRAAKEISPVEDDVLREPRLHFFQIELTELRPVGKHQLSVEWSTPFMTVLSLRLTWLIHMDL